MSVVILCKISNCGCLKCVLYKNVTDHTVALGTEGRGQRRVLRKKNLTENLAVALEIKFTFNVYKMKCPSSMEREVHSKVS
jgi:hypothetical protein